MFARLCITPDSGVNHSMWTALKTTLSLDDALALDELSQVAQSQQHAQAKNDYRRLHG